MLYHRFAVVQSSEFVDLMTRMGDGELVVDRNTITSSGKVASDRGRTAAPPESDAVDSGVEEAKQAAAIEAAFGAISEQDLQARMAELWEAGMAGTMDWFLINLSRKPFAPAPPNH